MLVEGRDAWYMVASLGSFGAKGEGDLGGQRDAECP
jgi:hypothetical protein